MFDPLELTKQIEPLVTKNSGRRYYRLVRRRPERWYGGIATSDCSGCNLRCIFCWSNDLAREGKLGEIYSPEQVFKALTASAKKFGYGQVRVSGNEPTIARRHLIELLELFDTTNYRFILETNGILIGYDKSYARDLSRFKCLEVRVSIKGTSEEEFSKLTGAEPKAFNLQLEAIKNLLDYGVDCYPAVMFSFSPKENLRKFSKIIKEIDRRLEIEEEYVILYPHVVKRLKEANIKPLIAYRPDGVPTELI